MQKIAFIAVIVLSLSAVILGRLYYGNKLEEISASAHEQLQNRNIELSEPGESDNVDSNDEEDNSDTENTADVSEDRLSQLEELTEGLSSSVSSLITEYALANEEIQLTVFGSRANEDSMNEGVDAWPELLEGYLNAQYGQDLFSLNNQSFGALTSNDVIAADHHSDVAELESDIVIIEPFNWNDNNAVITIEDTINNLQTIIDTIEEENDGVVIFIQPPQPAYNTVFYPEQVEQVAAFAEENDYLYIDHWQAWPDLSDEALLGFMYEGENMPNQDGHTIWMEYVSDFFVAN